MQHHRRARLAFGPRLAWTALTTLVAMSATLTLTQGALNAARDKAPQDAPPDGGAGPVVTVETRGLAVSAFATPYLGSGQVASVLLGVEANGPPGWPGDAVVAVSYSIQTRGVRSPVRTVSVGVGSAADGRRAAPFLTEMALPRGRHDILISTRLHEQDGPAFILPIDVPGPAPPGTTGFSMSPIVLASSTSPAMPYGDASDDRRVLPILFRPPSPNRVFHADEKVELFTEIYDWESEPGQELQYAVTTSVRDAAGVPSFVLEELGISEPLASGRYGFAQSTLIPVHRLVPGRYVVEVGVQSLVDPNVGASRTMAFAVQVASTSIDR